MNKDLHHKEIFNIFIVMNLQENIYRIQSMMGVITEDKDSLSRKMIDELGVMATINLLGSFDYSMEDYVSREQKIKFIKEVVEKLCEKYGDDEVAQYNLNGNQIQYGEEDGEKQMIEYYTPGYIVVERYKYKEDEMYDDYYLGAFEVPYEKLSDSLINEIFHLMLGEI